MTHVLQIPMTTSQDIAIEQVLRSFHYADVSLALNGRPGVWLSITAWHATVIVGVEDDGTLTSRDTSDELLFSDVHRLLDYV